MRLIFIALCCLLVPVLGRAQPLIVYAAPEYDGYYRQSLAHNVVLFIGVTQLPNLEQQRLREMGAWLARMGDAVYGTRGGPWEPVARQYGYRYKGSTVFVHLLQDYPGTTFKVPALGGLRVKRVYEVYTGRPLPFEGDGAVTVRDIDRTSSTADSVIAVEYQDEVQRVWTP